MFNYQFVFACFSLVVIHIGMTTAEELSQEQKDKIVSMHNKIRYDVKDGDLLELKWEYELASKASGWAQNCQWPHNPDRQSTLGTVGENIAVTKGGIVEGINYLASEKEQWNYETECEVKDGCGHYTQLIWENTDKVGCGLQKCDSISGLDSDFNGYEYLVCNYYPAFFYVAVTQKAHLGVTAGRKHPTNNI